MNGWQYGWMNEYIWMDERINECMDEWIDG